jgi:hypothetical protein
VVTIESFAEVVTSLSNCIPTVEVEQAIAYIFPGREENCGTRNVNSSLGSYRELSAQVYGTNAEVESVRFQSANLSVRNANGCYKRKNQYEKFFHDK